MPQEGDMNTVLRHVLKTPRGMRDIEPAKAWMRKKIFDQIEKCFAMHGAAPLDTPVCELRETLVGKYGEESKLIYNLEDQGGEALSLRYDLTVPFARYLGQNKIQAMTRYQIAKVYRRDNPSFSQGRYREFYQCDIDFAGTSDPMMADAECLQILCEILKNIEFPQDFTIKINHRSILDGVFQVTGVPQDKFKPICSAIDKLDKMSWDDVKKEMCSQKGLDEAVADKIGTYVSKSGDKTLIDELMRSELGQNKSASQGLKDLESLYSHADGMGISKYLSFDLSLARGLDYYTGLIYEAAVTEKKGIGSIAAGGRYDNLVGSLVDNANFHVPCVGLSVGIERIFAIMNIGTEDSVEVTDSTNLAEARIHCLIGSTGKGMSVERYKILKELRENGIRVRNVLKSNVKPLDLYQACEKDRIPFSIFFGPRDLEKNQVCLKDLAREQEEVALPNLMLANLSYILLYASVVLWTLGADGRPSEDDEHPCGIPYLKNAKFCEVLKGLVRENLSGFIVSAARQQPKGNGSFLAEGFADSIVEEVNINESQCPDVDLTVRFPRLTVLGACLSKDEFRDNLQDSTKLKLTDWRVRWQASRSWLRGNKRIDKDSTSITHSQEAQDHEVPDDCRQTVLGQSLKKEYIRNAMDDIIHRAMSDLVQEAVRRLPNTRKKRQTPCQKGEELDDYVDQLVRFGSRIIRASEPISLPNTTIELPEYGLQLFLYDGKGTRLHNLRRAKQAWVYCKDNITSLGLTTVIDNMQVTYKLRAISDGRLLFDGDLQARLSPRSQIQFSATNQQSDDDEVQQRIDRFRLFSLGRVFVIVRGLGNYTQTLSMILNSYLNGSQDELQPTLRNFERDIVALLNRRLAGVNVPILSTV